MKLLKKLRIENKLLGLQGLVRLFAARVPKVPENDTIMSSNQNKNGFIPTHGGYSNLVSYQKAAFIYDGTVFLPTGFLKNTTVLLTKCYKLHVVAKHPMPTLKTETIKNEPTFKLHR